MGQTFSPQGDTGIVRPYLSAGNSDSSVNYGSGAADTITVGWNAVAGGDP